MATITDSLAEVSAAVESGDPEATARVRAIVAVAPDNADAQGLLGRALLIDGDLDGAAAAFRTSVRLNPGDTASVVALGHITYRRGREPDATLLLEQAAEADPTNVGLLHNLVDLHSRAGRSRKALEWAEHLVERSPGDVLGLLKLAELYLAVSEHSAARDVFARLRDADDQPGLAILAVHGMIESELRSGRLRAALDLAVSATTIDRDQLTSDVLAYVVTLVFGEGERPSPAAEDVYAALAQERRAYRQELEEGVIG